MAIVTLSGCLGTPLGIDSEATAHGDCEPLEDPRDIGGSPLRPLEIDILNDRYEDALVCVYVGDFALLEGWARESDVAPNVQSVGKVDVPGERVAVRVEEKREGMTANTTVRLEAENYLTIRIYDEGIGFIVNHQPVAHD